MVMFNQQDTDIYETGDFYEAAVLRAEEKEFIGIRKVDKRCYFSFKDKIECEQIIREFWGKTLEINAYEFVDAIKALKQIQRSTAF